MHVCVLLVAGPLLDAKQPVRFNRVKPGRAAEQQGKDWFDECFNLIKKWVI